MKKVKKRLELNKTTISSLNLATSQRQRQIVGGDESDDCFCTIEDTECIQIGCGTSAPTWTDQWSDIICPESFNFNHTCNGPDCWFGSWGTCPPGGGGGTGGTGTGYNSWNPLNCY